MLPSPDPTRPGAAPIAVGVVGALEAGDVRQPRFHRDDVRSVLAGALLLVVVAGVFFEAKTALDLKLVSDLRDVKEIFAEPLAAVLGAFAAAIGFFFADRRA